MFNKKSLLLLSISFTFLLLSAHFLNLGLENNYKEFSDQIFIDAYFSPEDNIKFILIDLINKETEHIQVASFRFTDKDIFKALVNAFNRGVFIEIVSDKGCLGMPYSKILSLFNNKIPIYVFPPVYSEDDDLKKIINIDEYQEKRHIRVSSNALMHNKFFLFHGLHIVFTGSFNFTQAANSINQENALVIFSQKIFNKYLEYFERLKLSHCSFFSLNN